MKPIAIFLAILLFAAIPLGCASQQGQQQLSQARAITDAAIVTVSVVQAQVDAAPPGPKRDKLLQQLAIAQGVLTAAQAFEAALVQPTTQPAK